MKDRPPQVLVMRYLVRGEYRVVIPAHMRDRPSGAVAEALRAIDGVYGLDPESIRFTLEGEE